MAKKEKNPNYNSKLYAAGFKSFTNHFADENQYIIKDIFYAMDGSSAQWLSLNLIKI